MNKVDTDNKNELVPLARRQVDLQIGSLVEHKKRVFQISEVFDFEMAVGVDVESGKRQPLQIKDLVPVERDSYSEINEDIANFTDKDWKIAQERFSAIKPFLKLQAPIRSDVESRAKEYGVSAATLYRWLKRFKANGTTAALVPGKRGWTTGNTRISAEAEAIIQEVIDDYYLTVQRSSIEDTTLEVHRRCHMGDVERPSAFAIRARIHQIRDKQNLTLRGRKERAKNLYTATPGKFPNAEYPLQAVQIDHTPADIILVDDLHRKPIGRPWLSLAMDVCTRMVTGYYLSFDAPSETSVALCMAHSMIPKDDWLVMHKVDSEWPVWGLPETIHVDNGSDFRSINIRKSCEMYGINIEFRPVKVPRYGGHIERLLGTFSSRIHNLPGTTFSSIKEKEDYDSEKHATLTLSEFEVWLVTYICEVYHKSLHSELGVTPLHCWEKAIFGTTDAPGMGIPKRPADRKTLLLDFLPAFQRTIQRTGVKIDCLSYYHEMLRKWINAKDPDDRKLKRKFTFRRDPRDISKLWFKDPETARYIQVSFADIRRPALSAWELKRVKAALKKEGRNSVNEAGIFQALTKMRKIVDQAAEKTTKARRQAQVRKVHKKSTSPAEPFKNQRTQKPKIKESLVSGLLDEDLDDFGGIK